MHDLELHLVDEVRAGRLTRREMVRRATVLGFSMSAIGTLISACGGGDGATDSASSGTPATGSPRRGGTGTFGLPAPTADVDPVTMSNTGAIQTAELAGEYLAFPDEKFGLQPMLATKWEPGATPKEWTFHLREGVKFHSGAPMTSADVVATFERLTDPKSNSAALSSFNGILSHGNTEAVDDMTVKFHLDRAFVDFPYIVSAFNYNTIVLPENYELGQFTKGGVGTGPFILKSFNQSQGADYVKNPDYWDKGKPYLDAAKATYYPDPAAIGLAMQAKEIDVFTQAPYQGSEALLANPEFRALENPSSGYREVQMRVDRDPFTDKRVRQAIALCVDREALVESLFGGKAEVGADHAFAPIFPSAPDPSEVPPRTQDYEQAKQLLADAGHPDGVSVTLTTKRFIELADYAVILKEQLKPAGIDVEVKIETPEVFDGSGDNQPWLEVPMGIVPWGARGVPSQLIVPAYTCDGVWNSAKWCDESFDKVLADFDAELDEQKRKQLALEAAKTQAEEVPAIIAYWISDLRITQTRVNGLAGAPSTQLNAAGMWLSS
jgi:peptide/nickel transport system substrate-binding protein